MSPVVHFEMGYKNKTRMIKFYETVFSWKTQQTGPEMGNYVMAATTDTDDQGMVQIPGNINGGFYDKSEPSAPQAPSIVVQVDDIKSLMQAATDNGGKILGVMGPDGKRTQEPQMIPGVGLWMAIEDTEGNRLSMIEPPKT